MLGGDQPATGTEPDLEWPPSPGSLNSPRGKPTLSVEGELGQCVLRVCSAWPVWEIPGGAHRESAVLGDARLQRQGGQI